MAAAMMATAPLRATHSSYSSFATALQEGCFVCNTLLRNKTNGAPLSIPESDSDREADITTFGLEYLEGHQEFSCSLNFSVNLPSDSTSPEISRQEFILQTEGYHPRLDSHPLPDIVLEIDVTNRS